MQQKPNAGQQWHEPTASQADAPVLDVDKALEELQSMPAAALHRAAASAWGARAVASYRICLASAALEDGLRHLHLGEQYREAALAHASLGESWQPLHAAIDGAMAADRAQAFEAMRRRSASAAAQRRTRPLPRRLGWAAEP